MKWENITKPTLIMSRKKYHFITAFWLLILLPSIGVCETNPYMNKSSVLWNTVKDDYSEFYSKDRLIRLGLITAGFGIFANSSIDETIQSRQFSNTEKYKQDDGSVSSKSLGEGIYLLPICLVASVSDKVFSFSPGFVASPVDDWGKRTARSYLLGAPLVLAMQRITGGSRPGENEKGSKWKPFQDSNGVSGHAFIGAVPFLNIARMYPDNKLISYFCYLASTAAAISRVTDDQHYISQAVLGWYYAWEATDAVNSVEKEKSGFSLEPIIDRDRYGIQLRYNW